LKVKQAKIIIADELKENETKKQRRMENKIDG
jgi:hypothetical protein